MDELGGIKALESELAAELERARKDGEARVEAARAGRSRVVEEACRRAEAEAERIVVGQVDKADAEARKIKADSEVGLKKVEEKYSKNSRKAVEYVLRELGV